MSARSPTPERRGTLLSTCRTAHPQWTHAAAWGSDCEGLGALALSALQLPDLPARMHRRGRRGARCRDARAHPATARCQGDEISLVLGQAIPAHRTWGPLT